MDAELRKKVLTEWQNKKKETLTHPYLKEKVEWGMVPLCTGHAPCKISSWRSGWISCVFMEMRWNDAGIDHL